MKPHWRTSDHGAVIPTSKYAPRWDAIKRQVRLGATVLKPTQPCNACLQYAWRKRRGKDEYYCTECES